MASNNCCPECGNSFLEKTKRCLCGWRKAEINEPTRADHRCWYAIAERRCPLPGTMSPGFRAWYCRRHYQTLGDPRLGEAELIYIEKNFNKIIEDEYTDWRKKLFDK
jgi:hypothetical protein